MKKTIHTESQLRTQTGFPICFGGEKIEFKLIDDTHNDVYPNKYPTISKGFENDFVLVDHKNGLSPHYEVPLSEFYRLGMIAEVGDELKDSEHI